MPPKVRALQLHYKNSPVEDTPPGPLVSPVGECSTGPRSGRFATSFKIITKTGTGINILGKTDLRLCFESSGCQTIEILSLWYPSLLSRSSSWNVKLMRAQSSQGKSTAAFKNELYWPFNLSRRCNSTLLLLVSIGRLAFKSSLTPVPVLQSVFNPPYSTFRKFRFLFRYER